jgi:F0F1-type ATP synthase assembly protein I
MNINDKKEKSKKIAQNFAKYSGLSFVMGGVIFAFNYAGRYLDVKFQTETPWFNISLSLIGVFTGMYLALKDFIIQKPEKKTDDEKLD